MLKTFAPRARRNPVIPTVISANGGDRAGVAVSERAVTVIDRMNRAVNRPAMVNRRRNPLADFARDRALSIRQIALFAPFRTKLAEFAQNHAQYGAICEKSCLSSNHATIS